MGKDYGSWSLADLKNELRKRNARVTGKKAILVQRLEDYDKLFGPLITDTEPAFKINVPDPENFRDVTGETAMPVLTEDDLKRFSEVAQREDVITSKNMYKERFLISCRQAQSGGYFFMTGLCASEMRKNLTYNVTIKVKDHMIVEAQCECAAGIGPNCQCKHALVLIYAVIAFNKNKSICLKSSCTSQLQTFHQPSTSYSGNPVRAEDLTLRFKNKIMKDMVKFDPRPTIPVEEKYVEEFKNLIANYQGKRNMPISQILMPGDKCSLFKDHDYLEKTAEEEFFDSLYLTEEQIHDMQKVTNEKEWLKLRCYRLQSSNFGKICKRQSKKFKLACEILQNIQIQSPALNHGKKYELEALKKFQEVTRLSVKQTGIIIHPEEQFLGCTPDALVENNEVLEIKCPYSAKNKFISPESVPYIYLCEESGNYLLSKNHEYFYQVQGQLFCTQCNVAIFFIYTLCDFYLIRIHRDDVFIKNMIEKLKLFYNDYYKAALLNRYLYDKKMLVINKKNVNSDK